MQEGSAIFKASAGKISKKLPVFYNPVMKLNRDISVLLLKNIDDKELQIGDIMAASGIRSIRFLKELPLAKISSIALNDLSEESVKQIKHNISENKLSDDSRLSITQRDANIFLYESSGFDYIEVDPFGTPNPFLDAAVTRLSRRGILAVTATDTSALSGTYPSVCKRKYWAVPMRNYLMHEVGLRILIRKIQLIGAQYEKALVPIFAHSNDHYMRVYLKCAKSKSAVDSILKSHKFLLICNKCMHLEYSETNNKDCCSSRMQSAGPIWSGKLWDAQLAEKMLKSADCAESNRLLSLIAEEAKIDCQWHYNIHVIAKKLKLKIPRTAELLAKIQAAGYKSSRTHFSDRAIRTDMHFEKLISLMSSL